MKKNRTNLLANLKERLLSTQFNIVENSGPIFERYGDPAIADAWGKERIDAVTACLVTDDEVWATDWKGDVNDPRVIWERVYPPERLQHWQVQRQQQQFMALGYLLSVAYNGFHTEEVTKIFRGTMRAIFGWEKEFEIEDDDIAEDYEIFLQTTYSDILLAMIKKMKDVGRYPHGSNEWFMDIAKQMLDEWLYEECASFLDMSPSALSHEIFDGQNLGMNTFITMSIPVCDGNYDVKCPQCGYVQESKDVTMLISGLNAIRPGDPDDCGMLECGSCGAILDHPHLAD